MNLEYFKDKIYDELCGAKEYIIKAMEIKAMDPSWGKMFSSMSEMELSHAENLYKMANEYYAKVSKAYSTPPVYMSNLHKDIVDCYAKMYSEIKLMHEAYNK